MDDPIKRSTADTASQGPLAGIRVVDSSSYMTGPLAATMLADLGATVVKVEPPGGDGFRAFGHKVAGFSALWSNINRGKRSIVLDLKSATDLGTMKALLATADVLVENWRPHVAGSLGLGQEVLEALNPRLVRLSITGFGDSGPLSRAPAYDSLIQGHTGMVHLLSAAGAPDVAPYWVVDKVVAAFGSQSILAALYAREHTGKGSHVSLPMLDVMAYFNFPDMFQHRTFTEDETPWRPAFNPVVRTSDGYVVVAPVNGGQISRTLKALERPDIKAQMLAIHDHGEMVDCLYAHLNEIMSAQPTAHWLALLEPFDVPIAPVRTLDEHLADAQVKHNRIYRELPSPAGPMRVPRFPARFDRRQLDPAGAPPLVDADGARIRAELAAHDTETESHR
ncbi:CoA transferase [Variovorax guangxiensis]|uniref:CaiB/BaiF CoA transferase family protein n=1 Tax=Variovorax guangxiensis TaxID=1775474 RepID=UPI0028552B43|nr:CoA transferase [Variovorax guangxiensis]MDR6855874.1 crotonobetainyl-CoA:carnitine CoA-transferase CaiB-like acyl-CoA transferase [Variovorax guangxiensis]